MLVVLLVPVFLERASTFFRGCESVIARSSFGPCQFVVMRVDERRERSDGRRRGKTGDSYVHYVRMLPVRDERKCDATIMSILRYYPGMMMQGGGDGVMEGRRGHDGVGWRADRSMQKAG